MRTFCSVSMSCEIACTILESYDLMILDSFCKMDVFSSTGTDPIGFLMTDLIGLASPSG